jgi:hypothetical protein
MEANLQVQCQGVQEELAIKIGNAISELLHALSGLDVPLDFRRMHRIIVTADFPQTLAQLSESTASGNSIEHTNENYAVAVAKVVLLPKNDDIEIVPVFNAHYASELVLEEGSEEASSNFRYVLHLMHHEFCHVHDDNKKIDSLNGAVLKHKHEGKDSFLFPLAEVCWAEYIANYMSSSTATDNNIADITTSFADAIERAKSEIDAEIGLYRGHADLDHLMSTFKRHGEFLIKCASYTLGYMDGLNASLGELSQEAHDALNGSYFETIWVRISEALSTMREKYPNEWSGLDAYDALVNVMDLYYQEMGFYLSTTEGGGVYVSIP